MSAVDEILKQLRAQANPRNVEGQARYGIRPTREILGLSAPQMRAVAKPWRGDHDLALALWDTGVHEARHVAAMIDDAALVTKGQMDAWARTWDSWDICNGCCFHLFDRTPHAVDKAFRWAKRRHEFVKRGAFALMASLAVHDKQAPDELFRSFLPVIEGAATDDRTYVRKGVNWALRQIGKRNAALYADAVASAERIARIDARAARWIASDALRELRGDKVRARLGL